MLVYGDRSEFANPRERLASVSRQLDRVRSLHAGIERHSALVAALIDAGKVLQGAADIEQAPLELEDFVYRLARAAVRSHDSRYAEFGELPVAPLLRLPPWVELREPEGFAFYSVYPEAYVAAARKLALLGPPRVIGIRSIGTTLGAVVAAALGAPPPVSVRPFGESFARRVELPLTLIEEEAHYVIVDEGPGLSGSSFGSVADWLEQRGVPLERIAFLPSHGGDLGPQASASHRQRWHRAQRVATEFDADFLSEGFGGLEEFRTGHPGERRKYLGTRDGARVLLKFAGLGAIGRRKLEMALALHRAGLTPEPLGLVHGFLVERWCEDALPLRPDERPVAEMGRYIAARAALFPAAESSGATIAELLAMCRRNIGLALGEAAMRRLDHWDCEALARRVVRLRTDNKLDRGEWLRDSSGRLLKTDALDHHCAHDVIGCQDLAWDVVGATVEFSLTPCERDALVRTVERASGRTLDRELLAFYSIAYCAFRLGAATFAGQVTGRYADELNDLLHQHVRSATRRESLVDWTTERTGWGTNPLYFG